METSNGQRAVDGPITRALDDQSTRAVEDPSIRAVDDPITRAVDDPSTRAVDDRVAVDDRGGGARRASKRSFVLVQLKNCDNQDLQHRASCYGNVPRRETNT